MAVWTSFAALAVLAFIGPVLAQNSTGTEVELKQSICKPEEKTVELDLPTELNVVYIPNSVRLKRCGGGCQGSMIQCRPTKTEDIRIKVERVSPSPSPTRSSRPERGRERPGSSGRDVASRRSPRYIVEMISVPEQQHIECDCLCRIQEKDCNPALKEYMPFSCNCRCHNSDEEEECVARFMTHYWDDDQCTCFCRKTVNCSVTLLLDHNTCSCVQIPQNLFPNAGSARNHRVGFVDDNALDAITEGNERF